MAYKKSLHMPWNYFDYLNVCRCNLCDKEIVSIIFSPTQGNCKVTYFTTICRKFNFTRYPRHRQWITHCKGVYTVTYIGTKATTLVCILILIKKIYHSFKRNHAIFQDIFLVILSRPETILWYLTQGLCNV